MPGSADTDWLIPGHHGSPAEALLRIGAICQSHTDLYSALLTVLATHQGLQRDILAAATRQFRPELADLTRDDVSALLVSIWVGGREGFNATLRARRKGDRKGAALGWVKE